MTITITLTGLNWDEIKAQGQAMFSAPVVIVSEAASPVTAHYESGAVSVSQAEEKPKRTRAKADADGWIKHDGGPCPVDGDVWVEVRLKSGNVMEGNGPAFSWGHLKSSSDIAAWRPAKAEANNSPQFANNSPPEPEADAPFADAPADPPAPSSEVGSDEPASGTATPASDEPEVTYDDVTRAVLQLSKNKGPDAVRSTLASFGLTTARGTDPSLWPAILAAMQEAGA